MEVSVVILTEEGAILEFLIEYFVMRSSQLETEEWICGFPNGIYES